MDISTRTDTIVNEDQTWIGNGGIPIGQPRSIVLDRSAIDFAATFTNGVLPSGVALGRITATGLYAIYDDAFDADPVTAGQQGDGREVMAGHLFASIPVDSESTGDLAGALFWSGEVIEANLPANHGLDAAGKTDVANHIAYV